MASIITIAGEQLFAQKAQANQQLDIDTFIFANVPGQDPAAPIDRDEAMPVAGQQVHTQIVQQVGRINENVVVYSTVIDSVTGDFDFNWVGLYSSVNDTLVAINHIPTTTKTATNGGVAGNTLNRNFGIEYSGIADLTGITVAPETWQLDFTARLAGMDDLTRKLAMDLNGKDSFIDDGFKIVPRATVNTFDVTLGAGYVSGLRIEQESEHILTITDYPKFVYVDAYFDGDASSTWKPQHSFTISDSELTDYTDGNGKQHYVVKLATVSSADIIIDLRENEGLSEKIEKLIKKTNTEFDNVEELKEATGLQAGQKITTQGYYASGDGGSSKYITSTNSDVDGYSSFDLGGGIYAHLQHEGVIKSTQFGVMPDGVNNWEGTQGARMIALYGALNKGIEVKFVRVDEDVLYSTGMNIYNYYAQNWTMSFDEGVEFGNILHIISSGSAIFDRVLTTIPTGVNPTITFAVAHGMVTQRYVDFEGTGTNLDGGSYLITPAAANTAVVTATVTGANTGTGVCSDTAIKNVTLKGTYTTYDRWGLINVDGLKADRIVCKSDASKHTTGLTGGGVHIFTMCKNFDVGEIIIEDTANQVESANQHAAFACDGIGLESLNFGKVWVKDTKVNGAILQGEGYHIGQLIIDAYGNSSMSSVIPFVGASDLFGQSSYRQAHGLWISRATGRIDHVVVNQKYGFSGRTDAKKDVMFDRDFLEFNSPNQDSFIDLKTGFSIGHIEIKNPQYVGVDFGAYQGWCTPTVEKITFGIIHDDNNAVSNDALRLTRGLVNIGYTRAKIGQIRCANLKEAKLLQNNVTYTLNQTAGMGRDASINIGQINFEDHSANAIELHCPHTIDSITTDKVTVKDSYYLEPTVVIGTRAYGSNIGRIVGRFEAGQVNKSLLEYGATGSTIGSIQAYNYVANKTTNNAVVHVKHAKYSSINNVKIEASALSGTGGGIKYTGTYQFKTDTMLVDDMNQGVIDGGGNGRMIAIGCVSLANTTATDLPSATLVGDIGNFQWTI